MRWVLIIGLAWPAVSVVAALLLGASIRLADRRQARTYRTAEASEPATHPRSSPSAGSPTS